MACLTNDRNPTIYADHHPSPIRAELVEALSFSLSRRMTFWAYILHCNGGRLYVGHTENLEYRIAQHESGSIPSFTRDYLPVKLIWSDAFGTRIEALEAERRLKGWSRAKKLALVRGDWALISALAKGKDRPSTSSGRTDGGMANKDTRPEDMLPFLNRAKNEPPPPGDEI